MIKGFLCIVIILFSALAGWSKASIYSDRVKELTNLTTNLKYLESEMGYRMEPIPAILSRIGESRGGKAGTFFTETVRLLKDQEAETLWEAWILSLNHVYGKDALSAEDKKIIEELGYELGRTDMETQRGLFAHCYTGLSRQAASAAEESRTRGRMYKGLGVSVGILTAILLL